MERSTEPERQLRRVLVLDDDRDLVEVLVAIFESRDYRVCKASNVAEARELTRANAIDVALIDIRLSSEDGLAAIPILKREHPGLHCVVMTAYADTDTAIRALDSGAYGFLRKPLNPEDLVATLDRCFERVELERQLVQAQKMEAVGLLAGGIAHDFNNILTIIMGNVEAVSVDLGLQDEPDERMLARLRSVTEGAERAAALTRQLLAIGRRQVIQAAVFDVREMVEGLADMVRRLLKEGVELRLNLEEQPLAVRADIGQIELVVLNLVFNARDAMPEGGTLDISCERARLDPGGASGPADDAAIDCVRLTISDTGGGMDRETLDRIFEPFFTTKRGGSGLGLFTAYSIVRQTGGLLTAASTVGEGTRMSVYLPLATTDAEAPLSAQGQAEGASRAATILLCEDDAAVRSVTATALERAGYSVLVAASPEEALRIGEQRGGATELLLTDIIMPQMTGLKLSESLRATHPHLKCLFFSGYASNALDENGVEADEVDFLNKPFRSEELVLAVRRILSRDG